MFHFHTWSPVTLTSFLLTFLHRRYWLVLFISLFMVSCSPKPMQTGLRTSESEPLANRILVQRPGLGEQLDKQLATLLLENKRQTALRLCNDILFSSRSKEDRETAYYWRTFISALEQIDNKDYKKVIEVFEKGSKWWKSPNRVYHIQILTQLTEIIIQNQRQTKQIQVRTRELEKVDDLKQLNEQLASELLQLRKKNEELEKLLLKLENK